MSPGSRKDDHITPALVQLHCLHVSYHLSIFFCLYIIDWSMPAIICKESRGTDLLMQRNCKSKTYDDRALSVCTQKTWNTVSLEVQQSSTELSFKKKVKSFRFTKFVKSKLYHIFHFFLESSF